MARPMLKESLNKRVQKRKSDSRFYKLNSILGNDWAAFYVIVGGRMTGKSYSITDFLCNQKKKYGNNCKNYWMRISETSTKALLSNKADKLVDPDLKRKYDLELTTKGFEVMNRGEPFMTVLPLSQFGKLKGVGFYDKDFDGYYNLVLDEFQLELGERRASFDLLYSFICVVETLVRDTKKRIRVFLVGNTLEEASTILRAFNFIPEKFGRFYLKSKRCIIDNLEPTEEYLQDRYGSMADILGGDKMSNYTNELMKDNRLIKKTKLEHIQYIIKFTKHKCDWYTVWNGNVITPYKGQPCNNVVAMRPYLDEYYSYERKLNVVEMYDSRSLYFKNYITQSYFQDAMSKIRK